ncbi:MAG TPA: MarR family transcriptional regulator [Pseudonocardiaceae bacterium]
MPTDQPRWLNQRERDAWLPFVGLLLKLPHALDSAMRRTTGLSHFEYLVLSALSDSTEHTRPMSELAEIANASQSRLSHVVAKLEENGLVRRSTCPGNGRVVLATLTEAGYREIVAMAPRHVDVVRALVIDTLDTEQLDQLTAICARIRSAVDREPPTSRR